MFETSFFPYCIKEWCKLNDKIKSNTNSIKLLSCLKLDFSHLNKHKFRHNFNDKVNIMYTCALKPLLTAL